MDRSRPKKTYRWNPIAAANKDDRPAVAYAANVTPTDVGLSEEFGCIVWLAFYSLHLPHCYLLYALLSSVVYFILQIVLSENVSACFVP